MVRRSGEPELRKEWWLDLDFFQQKVLPEFPLYLVLIVDETLQADYKMFSLWSKNDDRCRLLLKCGMLPWGRWLNSSGRSSQSSWLLISATWRAAKFVRTLRWKIEQTIVWCVCLRQIMDALPANDRRIKTVEGDLVSLSLNGVVHTAMTEVDADLG